MDEVNLTGECIAGSSRELKVRPSTVQIHIGKALQQIPAKVEKFFFSLTGNPSVLPSCCLECVRTDGLRAVAVSKGRVLQKVHMTVNTGSLQYFCAYFKVCA